ncbi:MAG: hypothetical protein ACFE8B_12585 [Candidatus Hermodarchaeota archaeon]
MSIKNQFLKHIENLKNKYENEEKSGIFFKLEKDKDPSEIIGVLDFLKYKIEKWGNTNIFSYRGSLFKRTITLIIGSSNSDEAITIIKYVYLTQVIKENNEILDLKGIFENIDEIDGFLNEEISKNITLGYPTDPKLERYLRNHIEKLINSE